jgi:AraC-like DNA-binding protein
MRQIIFYFVIITGLLSVSCGSSPETKRQVSGIDLSGKWKIIDTDLPDHADPLYDDSRFRGLAVPGDWLEVLEKNDNLASTVWVRRKIFIGKDRIMKQPVLSIGRIGVADEAYFNGVKIGSSGIIPASPDDLRYQIAWSTPRAYFIPGNLVRYGSDNVIALRIYSHIQSGIRGEVMIRDYYHDYFGQIFRAYRPLLVSAAAVILNIMLILVFALLFISERSKTEYLYFTLVIACTLACSFLTFTLPFMIDGLVRYKLGIFLYTLTNFFVLQGVKKFLACESRALSITALVLLLIVETFMLLTPDSRMLVFYNGFACLVFVNLCIISSSVMFMLAIKKDPRRYWYFSFLAFIPFSVMRNSYYIVTYRFNELPLAIFLHVPMVFMFITLYYIYNFEKSRKEKDTLYTALLKKSKNDSQLIHSLRKKNKKQEPRNLISSVIEYLDVNYAEKYERSELSKKFGLNEDYMGQVFKKATGMNISNYINNNRINAAKELLSNTGAKIIDVAYHVGFDNLTHFHRQFKKQTGCTPNEYRKKIRKDGHDGTGSA